MGTFENIVQLLVQKKPKDHASVFQLAGVMVPVTVTRHDTF